MSESCPMKPLMVKRGEISPSVNSIHIHNSGSMILKNSTHKRISNDSPKSIEEWIPNLNLDLENNSAIAHLDLSNRNLKDLPSFVGSMNNLKHLNLNDNSFVVLPSILGKLKELRTLKVSNNKLQEIPETLTNLNNLKELDLSQNNLKNLPNSWRYLNQVKKLSLRDNDFVKVPVCITHGMKGLESLDLSQNKNCEIDSAPRSINLISLYAKNNGDCRKFPTWIFNSKYYNLRNVVFDDTCFKEYHPNGNTSSVYIKKLSMQQCKLSTGTIGTILESMAHLEELNMGNKTHNNGNIFCNSPIEYLKNPLSLKKLYLSKTGISLLPRTVHNLVHITEIDLSHNTLTWLPNEFCELKNVKILIIDNNTLASLPDNIGTMLSLNEMKLGSNYLSELPDSLDRLKDLKYLDLYNNEFQTKPTVLDNLTNLSGLDLDCNHFSTADLLIGEKPYENMRTAVREHWLEDFVKSNMVKYSSPLKNEDDLTSNSSNDSDDIPSLCQSVESINNNSIIENWDISDNSADEFDPHECKEPKIPKYSPNLCILMEHQFCPADLHTQSTMDDVSKMLREGVIEWSKNHEEGQFEDP